MRTNLLLTACIAIALIIIGQSCERENENESMVSTAQSNKSHETGQNCGSCHKQGGTAPGWFTASGTVYDSLKVSPYPTATVKLYTGPNGTGSLVANIAVDAKGNFYTTEKIDFSSSLYTSVSGANRIDPMISAISSGQCSSCHGGSAARICAK
jgi:hypothetical protein